MGVVFFLGFMAILFFTATFFIIASIVFIIFYKIRKRRGSNPKKRWIVIPVVILVFNIIIALIPVGFFAFIRFTNSASHEPVEMAKSKKVIYWPMRNSQPNTDLFEMDGEYYVAFNVNNTKNKFLLDYSVDLLMAPIANIQYDPSYDSNLFNKFMFKVFSGKTITEESISAIYPVENENKFSFFYIGKKPKGDSIIENTYCARNELNSIIEYYYNASNYDTQNVLSEQDVFPKNKTANNKDYVPPLNVKKEIALNPGIFEELHSYATNKPNYVRFYVPKKYIDIKETKTPGASYYGYEQRELKARSKDNLAYRHIYIVLINDRTYVCEVQSYDYIYSCPLPDYLNQYVINTVFATD